MIMAIESNSDFIGASSNFVRNEIIEDKKIDIHADEEGAFGWACRNGHLEVAQWLLQLGQNVAGATSLRSAHDVRTSGISFYKSIGTDERSELSVSEVALATQFYLNIDIHARNDEAFRHACEYGRINIAQWLSTLCEDYLIVMDNDKIVKWLIKDENYIALDLIENNKYDKAIIKLNIKSVPIKNKYECMICYDEPSEIIELPCSHTLCLETIVKFNVINHVTTKICFYCQRQYQWDQCRSLRTKQQLK